MRVVHYASHVPVLYVFLVPTRPIFCSMIEVKKLRPKIRSMRPSLSSLSKERAKLPSDEVNSVGSDVNTFPVRFYFCFTRAHGYKTVV